ncbi:MAG: GNAT family N-acetyltransferase [Cyclobacteriaceae bacterium]
MISVRESSIEDIPTIVEFQQNMAKETEGITLNTSTLRAGVQRVFSNPTLAKYYVAESDGKVISCLLVCYEWSEWRNGIIFWIESVYVAKEERGKKVFTTMYRFLQQLVNVDGQLKGIRLYVDKSNYTAQKVYSKLGMDGEHYKMYEWMKP